MGKGIELFRFKKTSSIENFYKTKEETTIKFSRTTTTCENYPEANEDISGWHRLKKQDTWINGHALNILRTWENIPDPEDINQLQHTKDLSCFVWIFLLHDPLTKKKIRYKVFHEIEYDLISDQIIFEEHTVSVEDRLFSEQWSVCKNAPQEILVW